MFDVLSDNQNFVKASGYTLRKDGESVDEAMVFTDQLGPGSRTSEFSRGRLRGKRWAVDASLTARVDHIEVNELIKPGTKGSAQFIVPHDEVKDTGLQVVIVLKGVCFDCTLRPPKSETQSPYEPWETRKFRW